MTDAEKAAMGERLEAARWLAELSQRAVARTVGVSAPMVAQWEQGALPGPEHRAAIAKLYDQPEELLFAEYEALISRARELLRPA